MITRHLLCFAFSVSCAISFVIDAAKADECDNALIVSTYKSDSLISKDWRLAKYVSQSQYDQIKNNGSANAVIYGVPMGGSYSEFKENYRNQESFHNESLSEVQKNNVLWTGLDQNSLSAYIACKSNGFGLFLFPVRATNSQVELRIKYSPTSDGGPPLKLNWTGGVPEITSELPQSIEENGETTIVIPRPAGGSDILLGVNAGKLSASTQIAAFPSSPKRCQDSPTIYLPVLVGGKQQWFSAVCNRNFDVDRREDKAFHIGCVRKIYKDPSPWIEEYDCGNTPGVTEATKFIYQEDGGGENHYRIAKPCQSTESEIGRAELRCN